MKDVFGFAQHLKTPTYRLGYKLTLKNNINNYATYRAAATAILKISTKVLIGLSKLLFLRKQQRLLSEHSVSRAPKELHYNGIFVFRKVVKEQNA